MNTGDWMDLAVLERKKYQYLNEVLDLTNQLGSVLDRNDQVSVQMLLAMRQEPVLHLEEIHNTAKARRAALSEEDQARLSELLNGAAPSSDGEKAFAEQAGKASRLLNRVLELDKRLSIRFAGKDSFYNG